MNLSIEVESLDDLRQLANDAWDELMALPKVELLAKERLSYLWRIFAPHREAVTAIRKFGGRRGREFQPYQRPFPAEMPTATELRESVNEILRWFDAMDDEEGGVADNVARGSKAAGTRMTKTAIGGKRKTKGKPTTRDRDKELAKEYSRMLNNRDIEGYTDFAKLKRMRRDTMQKAIERGNVALACEDNLGVHSRSRSRREK